MKNFLEGLTKDLGGLAEVKKYNFRFGNYKLVLFDSRFNELPNVPKLKEWYLRADYSERFDNGEAKYSNCQLLISIINLAKKIEENDGLKEELAFCNEVIEWCVNYGHPFEMDYFKRNYYEDSNGNPGNRQDYISLNGEECPRTVYFGFSLKEFKRRIAVFYSHFQLWYGLAFDDLKRVIDFSPILDMRIDTSKKLDSQIISLKQYLALMVSEYAKTSVGIEYNEKNDSYSIAPHTSDLISVAYFQLTMLMTNKGFKGVKFCSLCHKLFEIAHGGTKMCDDCKREYHRIKTQESRMKKLKNN